MNAAIRNALSYLPPEINTEAMRLGIEPMRIEGSGAMRLRIDNKMPVTVKGEAINSFKAVLRSYGLDLGRITTDTTASSVWDSSLLMIKRNSLGHVVPLFEKSGIPTEEHSGRVGELSGAYKTRGYKQ
jgi:hypothetical protein